MNMPTNEGTTETSAKAEEIQSWEDEGGATPPVVPGVPAEAMLGTENQVEWAEQIKLRVDAEFDRVAAAIRSKADKRTELRESETDAILAILESKREDVMSRKDAGYFIHDWQEVDDQVRRMILFDERYLAIKASRKLPSP